MAIVCYEGVMGSGMTMVASQMVLKDPKTELDKKL
jgi:hypothetical protein